MHQHVLFLLKNCKIAQCFRSQTSNVLRLRTNWVAYDRGSTCK